MSSGAWEVRGWMWSNVSSISTLLAKRSNSILSFSLMVYCFKLLFREGERKKASTYHGFAGDDNLTVLLCFITSLSFNAVDYFFKWEIGTVSDWLWCDGSEIRWVCLNYLIFTPFPFWVVSSLQIVVFKNIKIYARNIREVWVVVYKNRKVWNS